MTTIFEIENVIKTLKSLKKENALLAFVSDDMNQAMYADVIRGLESILRFKKDTSKQYNVSIDFVTTDSEEDTYNTTVKASNEVIALGYAMTELLERYSVEFIIPETVTIREFTLERGQAVGIFLLVVAVGLIVICGLALLTGDDTVLNAYNAIGDLFKGLEG